MAYIGRNLEQFSNVEKLDNITFTNSAGPYNLLKGAVAFTPVNAQSLLIEVDGIIQASDSYTVSGSTITFGVSMASTSTMNSIVQLGVGLISTPADSTVTTAKLEDGAVTGAKVNSTFDVSAKTVTLPASVSGLGTGITNAQLAGSITDAKIIGLTSSKLTGALPAISGTSLTALNATNLGSGTVPDARFPATLPASSGVNLTALNATNLGSGTVPTARLGTGTASSSTFLRGDQTYAEAGGGAWTHLLTTTASDSDSIAFSSTYITTTYLDYMFVFSGIKFANDDEHPRLMFSTDNGSSYSANGTMKNARMGVNAAGNDVNIGQTGSSGLYMSSSQGVGNSTGEGFSGYAIIFDPLKQSGTTDMYTRMLSMLTCSDTSGDPVTSTSANAVNFATAVNNIKFQSITGNITSGKFSLYGRKHS